MQQVLHSPSTCCTGGAALSRGAPRLVCYALRVRVLRFLRLGGRLRDSLGSWVQKWFRVSQSMAMFALDVLPTFDRHVSFSLPGDVATGFAGH